jgi:hypothetical protein
MGASESGWMTPEQHAARERAEQEVVEIIDDLISVFSSITAAAEDMGVPKGTLLSWRVGNRRPSTGSLAALVHSRGFRLKLVLEPLAKTARPEVDESEVVLRQARALVYRLERMAATSKQPAGHRRIEPAGRRPA